MDDADGNRTDTAGDMVRVGDLVAAINGESVAGWELTAVHERLKKLMDTKSYGSDAPIVINFLASAQGSGELALLRREIMRIRSMQRTEKGSRAESSFLPVYLSSVCCLLVDSNCIFLGRILAFSCVERSRRVQSS